MKRLIISILALISGLRAELPKEVGKAAIEFNKVNITIFKKILEIDKRIESEKDQKTIERLKREKKFMIEASIKASLNMNEQIKREMKK